MKKFSFRLEALLQHRLQIEEKERNSFALKRAELLAEIHRKDVLLARQKDTLSDLMLTEAHEYDAREIHWYSLFLDRLTQEIRQSDARAVQIGKDLEIRKQAMIEAARNRKMIENLKTKKRKEYCAELDREDQKSIDEIVVTHSAHRL